MKNHTNSLLKISFSVLCVLIILSLIDRILCLMPGILIYADKLENGFFIPIIILTQVLVVLILFIYTKQSPLFLKITPKSKNIKLNIFLYLFFCFIYISIIIFFIFVLLSVIGFVSAILMPIVNEFKFLPEFVIWPIAFAFGSYWYIIVSLAKPVFLLSIISCTILIYFILLLNMLIKYILTINKKTCSLKLGYYLANSILLLISFGLFIYGFLNVVVLKNIDLNGYSYNLYIGSLFYYDKVTLIISLLFLITIILNIIFYSYNKKAKKP